MATDLAGECRRLWVESRCQVSVYALRSAATCLRVIQANQNYPSSSTNNTIPGRNTRLTRSFPNSSQHNTNTNTHLHLAFECVCSSHYANRDNILFCASRASLINGPGLM